ncbi:MAG: ShlB/FhaC/HecB family hemolysin secretion/activation protein [Venatoribacter sp.]
MQPLFLGRSISYFGGLVIATLGALQVLAAPINLPSVDAGQSWQELQTQPVLIEKPVTTPLLSPQMNSNKTPNAKEVTLALSFITFEGNKVFSGKELTAVTDNRYDQEVTLADLQEAADKVTAFYREQGYLVAYAYLPQQEVVDGEVKIRVVEGNLSEVRIQNHSLVSNQQIEKTLKNQLSINKPLESHEANRAFLLLKDLPGIDLVDPGLYPGQAPGSTAIDLILQGEKRYGGQIGLDNYGNHYTGHYRLTGGFSANSLMGVGDQLNIKAAISQNDGLDYLQAGWDRPVFYDGLRLGGSISNTTYELGKSYKSLDAYGTAQSFSLYGSSPIILSPYRRLDVSFSLEHRRLSDTVGVSSISSRKSANVFVLSIDNHRFDSFYYGGMNAWHITNTFGKLSMDSNDAKDFDEQSSAPTSGTFDKLVARFERIQYLPWRFSLYGNVLAQWANTNLDTSEKLFLGGPHAVRAYPQGEASGDLGMLMNGELRLALYDGLQLKTFYDYGFVRVSYDGYPTGPDYRSLGGGGFGLSSTWLSQRLTLDSSVAYRFTRAPSSDSDKTPRFWLQLGYLF